MKRFVFTTLILCIAFLTFSQTFYWTVYGIDVKNGQENQVMSAIDTYMKSESGKALPSMAMKSNLFANSENKASHSIVFFSTDKSIFGKMYSGILQQSPDFQLMASSLDQYSDNVGSYLGKSLYATPPASDNYEGVIALSVSDPATYLAAFKTFSDAAHAKWDGKIGMALHQFLSGQEPGVTHVVVIGTADFETYLSITDEIYQSDIFKNFNNKVKDIRKVKSNTSSITLARYNIPEE